ncbi:MAG: Ldh family oxidoreductase [Syntrophothermus sp.]
MSVTTTYNWKDLTSFCTRVLLKNGLSFDHALIVAEHLVEANLRGVDSHGVSRLGVYVERLRRGLINTHPIFKAKRDNGSTVLLDGDNGAGQAVAWEATRMVMERATVHGLAAVGVLNSNHCGMLAYYTRRMAQKGFIGVAMTSAPSTMAPWGGKKAYLGTNPFSISVPTREEEPIVFDMATSVVARGKIILAMKKKEPIPPGWATDAEGVPTTDPTEAYNGLVLPVGGPKGYSLSLMVDILSGVLTGACFGPYIGSLYDEYDRTQNVGHFFLAFNPDLFGDPEEFGKRLQMMMDEIRRSPRARGVDRIYMPGEIEAGLMEERTANGVPLAEEVVAELARIGQDSKVEFPFPLGEVAEKGGRSSKNAG